MSSMTAAADLSVLYCKKKGWLFAFSLESFFFYGKMLCRERMLSNESKRANVVRAGSVMDVMKFEPARSYERKLWKLWMPDRRRIFKDPGNVKKAMDFLFPICYTDNK